MIKEIKKHLVIQCVKCKDIIQSDYRHDYKRCKCDTISIDGGFDYCKIGFQKCTDFKQLYFINERGNRIPIPKKSKKKEKENNMPKKKRITTASAKSKGRNLQKLVCKKIGELLNMEYGYEDDKDIQPRLMGQSGTDVVLRKEVLKKFPYSVECKCQESWSLPAYIQQAQKNIIKNTDWLLVLKKNNIKPIVVLDMDVFFKILKEK